MADNLLKLADLLRERRLREMKAQSGAAEMELLGDSDEVAQVAELDFLIHMQDILIWINKILDILLRRR